MNEIPSIILLGLKHSGKSSIARSLAPFIQAQFYDLDELCAQIIIAQYKDRFDSNLAFQMIVRQFFKEEGKDAFKLVEANAVELWKNKSSFSKSILATGGGTMENSEATKQLENHGLKVFIDVPEETLFQRIMRGGIPPFLDPDKPRESFNEIYVRRVSMVREIADLSISINHETIEMVVAVVLKHIKEFTHAR